MQKTGAYWLITLEYPPSYGGGIGTYCLQNARMLQAKGWEVTVFVPLRSTGKTKVSYSDGIRIVEFSTGGNRSLSSLGYDTAMAFEFSQIIRKYLEKEGVPVILESQEYAGIAYYILQYKHLGFPLFDQLKVLLTIHAPSFLYHEYNEVPPYQLPYFWIGEMERWCIKAADAVNAPSHFITKATTAFFTSPPEKTIQIIPYPFEHATGTSHLDHDPRAAWFFFGKLTPQKGIFPLLSACRKLWQSGWKRDLKLIGGGYHYYHPEKVSMGYWIKRTYLREIKEKRLQLLGNLTPSAWKKITSQGCVVVVPSIGDNYPFTVLESLAAGQLVLTSVQGGQAEIVRHRVNGFLFDHSVPDDLANKIREIESLSPETIRTIRENAMASVREKHDYDHVYPLKLELIEEMLADNNSKDVFPFTRELYSSGNNGVKKGDTIEGLLSVVIPFYNMGNYITDTIESVVNSVYPHKEIIVVDDGSDDNNSLETLSRLKSKFDFILLRQSNQGLASARNAGAGCARGEFTAFVDADDKVHAAYYTKAIAVMQKKKNVSFAGSWVQYFEGSNNTWPAFTPEPPYILYYNMVCSGGLVYRTDAFRQHGWNDSKLKYGLEDWDSVISLVEQGLRGVVIPETFYYYRIRKGSMARKFNKEKLLLATRYIAEKHARIYAEFSSGLSALYNANGPGFKIDNPSLDYNTYGLLPEGFPLVRQMIKMIKRAPVLRKAMLTIHSKIKK